MSRYTSLVALIQLLTFSVSTARPIFISESDVSDQEYAIYSLLINEKYLRDKSKPVVVAGQTTGAPFVRQLEREDVRQIMHPLSQKTIDDFKERNKEIYSLGRLFSLRVEYVLLGKDENERFRAMEPTPGWEWFKERFPNSGGYFRVSRVGFNPERTQALVYLEHGCGDMCGTGIYALLIKEGGEWKIERMGGGWVA